MKTYVEDLQVNSEITSFFVLTEASLRKSKNNSSYMALKLSDKTGTIEGRWWNVPTNLDVSRIVSGIFVKVKASVGEYRDQLQLNITNIRVADPQEDQLDVSDFFRRSARPPEDMMRDLLNVVSNVPDAQYRNILFDILEKYSSEFMVAPAGKSIHHAYVGGLLEHVLSIAYMCELASVHYGLDRSIMVAAAVTHDLGKLRELTFGMFEAPGFSTEGTLLGHIVLGMDMLSEHIRKVNTLFGGEDDRGFSNDKKMKLMHMVASHHGLLEFGSPRVPLMKESIAFHFLDNMDSKLGICDEALRTDTGDSDTTAWVSPLGGPILKPTKVPDLAPKREEPPPQKEGEPQ